MLDRALASPDAITALISAYLAAGRADPTECNGATERADAAPSPRAPRRRRPASRTTR